MSISTAARSKRQAVLEAEKPPEQLINPEGIPESLTSLSRWVLWAWEWNGKKWTKIPKQGRFPKVNGSSTDPLTWCDFSTVMTSAEKNGCGVGFVFIGDGIIGIDLDDCRDPITEILCPWAQEIVDRLATYTEISPSGTGIKLFVRGELPEHFDKKYPRLDGNGAVEVFKSGRFFTVTGIRLQGTPDDVCDRPAELRDVMATLATWKPEKKQRATGTDQRQHGNMKPISDDRDTALAALSVLDPDMAYDDWLAVGMALHSVDPSQVMLNEFDRWSRGSGKYVDSECDQKWTSFHSGSVSIGTLCKLADDTGQQWRPIPHKSTFDTFGTSSSQANTETKPSEEWPDPDSLPDDLPDVEPFNDELLPVAYRSWCLDIAARMSCPPDYSAVAMIVSSAAVIGRKLTIRPKRKDDWTVVCNLWGCCVGRPGLMKTSCIQQGLKPIKTLAHEATEEHANQIKKFAAGRELALMKAKRIRNEVKSSLESGEVADDVLKQQLVDAQNIEDASSPPLRRYISMDGTYEATADMLNESPNGFLQYRDEMAGWWASLSREGQENARSFWLECWNGDGDYYIDRVGRGRMRIPSNTVSVLGATQPGKLRAYLQGAIKGDSTDDGMIQRHQMLVWPDSSDKWVKVDRWPDTDAKNEALEVFRRLNKIDPSSIGAEQNDGDEFPFLRFSAGAQMLFDDWLERLEIQLRSDEDPAHLESHFSKYRSLVPSLALIFHLIDCGQGPVGVDATQRAIDWSKYLASHARRAYGGTHGAKLDAAKKILKRIAAGELKGGFSVRDVYKTHQAGLENTEEAIEAIGLLEDFGWLRTVKLQTLGRPTYVCLLHPKIDEFLKREGIKSTKRAAAEASDTFDTWSTQENSKKTDRADSTSSGLDQEEVDRLGAMLS